MTSQPMWRRYLRFWGSDVDADIDDELTLHLEMRTDELIAAGWSPDAARAEARRRFGNMASVRRAVRDIDVRRSKKVRRLTAIDELQQDLRYGFRQLRRDPGFTLVAVLTLAIGIGANTAIFSVISGVILQPLPYDEPEELVAIHSRFTPDSGFDFQQYAVGSPEYFDYVDQNRSMEHVAAVSTEMVTVTAGSGDPEVVTGGLVSSSMFSVLRTPPLLGRTLIADDDGADPPLVFVLGYDLWQRRFGGDPGVLGQPLRVGIDLVSDSEAGHSGVIVGVMPEGFAYPDPEVELWAPLALDRARTWRGGHWFHMIGRLAGDTTLDQARAEMETLMAGWAREYPDHHTGHGLYLTPLLDDVIGDVRTALLLLFGAVGFVLLMACANVANLLMARAGDRRREIAARGALGAGRARLLRQLLTESGLLAALGGVAGIILAQMGVDGVLALGAGSIPRVQEVGLDGRVLAFVTGIVAVATLVFGLIPALQTVSVSVADAFRSGGGRATSDPRRVRFRQFLVVGEIALALLLVVGAGLIVKSFWRLLEQDPGFRADGLLTVQLFLPAEEYTSAQTMGFYARLTDEVASLPGVEIVTAVSRPPLLSNQSQSRFWRELTTESTELQASHVMVRPRMFEALGIPLLRGRLLTEADRAGAPDVVVIDEEMAQRYWPGEDPIGQRIRFASTEGPWHTIVGIVGNAKFDDLSVSSPTYYHSHDQASVWADFITRTMAIMVRTGGDPLDLARPIRAIVRTLDPNLPILRIQTMDEIVSAAAARPRFLATILGLFALVALILGTIGIYGLTAHSVAQRTNEIGIRMALGAEAGDVIRMVVRQQMSLVVAGVVVGLTAALVATTLLTSFLYQVSATDPVTFVTVAVLVSAVAMAASYVPARRASRVDPILALRRE